jgi:transcriptional regulator with XRE-family HTH domain
MPHEMRSPLAEKIREAREQAGYTSAEKFAAALGVSSATVYRWEHGSHEPSIRRLIQIAQKTGKPMSHFLDEVAA